MTKNMNLLIITQKVDLDDTNLAFFHGWIKKISEKVKGKIYVIANGVGRYDLPANVIVYSLGKEKKTNRLLRYIKFYKLLFGLIFKIDGVFCHMCPEYVIAAGPLVRLANRRLVFWYTHKFSGLRLRLAGIFPNKILTASKESFRLPLKKVMVVGHGIDTDFFQPVSAKPNGENVFNILAVGRIAPSKDFQTLINAIQELFFVRGLKNISVIIIGEPIIKKHDNYFLCLKEVVVKKKMSNIIKFFGGQFQAEIKKYYQKSDLLVNTSLTGSIDKVVLEAAACGLPAVVCAETFKDFFGSYSSRLIFEAEDSSDLVKKIFEFMASDDKAFLRDYLRERVVKDHNLDHLVEVIISNFV